MAQSRQTLIAVDDDVDFTADEFVAVWNAPESGTTQPPAIKHVSPPVFDADIFLWLGRAADIIGIATGLALPIIQATIQRTRAAKAARAAQSNVAASTETGSRTAIPGGVDDLDFVFHQSADRTYVRIKRRIRS
jgi:hypothetical protein